MKSCCASLEILKKSATISVSTIWTFRYPFMYRLWPHRHLKLYLSKTFSIKGPLSHLFPSTFHQRVTGGHVCFYNNLVSVIESWHYSHLWSHSKFFLNCVRPLLWESATTIQCTCLIIFVNVIVESQVCFASFYTFCLFSDIFLCQFLLCSICLLLSEVSLPLSVFFPFSSIPCLHVYTHILLFPRSSSLSFPYFIPPLLPSQMDLFFCLLLNLPLHSFTLAQTSNALLQRKWRKQFSSNYNIRQILFAQFFITFQQSWNDDLLSHITQPGLSFLC